MVENVEKKYGLDEPVPVQYVKYLGRLVTFDFGESYSNGEPVTEIIKQRAPASLRLATWAILVEAFVGIGAGILSAIRKYSIADTLTTLLAAVLSAIPVFVLGVPVPAGLRRATRSSTAGRSGPSCPSRGSGPTAGSSGSSPPRHRSST